MGLVRFVICRGGDGVENRIFDSAKGGLGLVRLGLDDILSWSVVRSPWSVVRGLWSGGHGQRTGEEAGEWVRSQKEATKRPGDEGRRQKAVYRTESIIFLLLYPNGGRCAVWRKSAQRDFKNRGFWSGRGDNSFFHEVFWIFRAARFGAKVRSADGWMKVPRGTFCGAGGPGAGFPGRMSRWIGGCPRRAMKRMCYRESLAGLNRRLARIIPDGHHRFLPPDSLAVCLPDVGKVNPSSLMLIALFFDFSLVNCTATFRTSLGTSSNVVPASSTLSNSTSAQQHSDSSQRTWIRFEKPDYKNNSAYCSWGGNNVVKNPNGMVTPGDMDTIPLIAARIWSGRMVVGSNIVDNYRQQP